MSDQQQQGSNLSDFGGFDSDLAQALQDEISRAGVGPFMKLVEGENYVRILPVVAGMEGYTRGSSFFAFWQHAFNGPDKQFITFVCSYKMSLQGELGPCQACDRAEELLKSRNPYDRKRAKSMSPQMRAMVNVINRRDELLDNNPYILEMGKGLLEDVIAIRNLSPRAGGGDFTSPDTGMDLLIIRTGTGLDTEYQVRPCQPTALSDEEKEVIMRQHDLRDHLRLMTPEEVAAFLAQIAGMAQGSALPPAARQSALPVGTQRSFRAPQRSIVDTAEAAAGVGKQQGQGLFAGIGNKGQVS